MSRENLEVVRAYFEAVTRGLASYWGHPRLVAPALTDEELLAELTATTRFLSLVTVRAGLIVRMEEFSDRAEAIKAVGISE